MGSYLAEELVIQNDFILKAAGQQRLIRVTRIPDPGLAHEIEACLMGDHCSLSLSIGTEEYRGTKHTLECGNQSPILRTALLHPEDVEHLGGTAECDCLFPLPHGEGSEKNGDQAVLTPRNSVGRMAGYL